MTNMQVDQIGKQMTEDIQSHCRSWKILWHGIFARGSCLGKCWHFDAFSSNVPDRSYREHMRLDVPTVFFPRFSSAPGWFFLISGSSNGDLQVTMGFQY